MRPANAAAYAPGVPPTNPADIPNYLLNEFQAISVALLALAAGHLDVTHKAPAKPRDVDLRVADGTDWNPGAGKGLYAHSAGVWTLIKALP